MVSSMKLVGLRIFAKLRILFNGGEHNFLLAGSIDNHKILKGD